MKEQMMLFGVTLAKRYTSRQKRIFYSQAEPFFKKLGYSIKLQEIKKKFICVSNILIGDIKKAQYIVVCPYDTPSKSLIPYKYYPYNLLENRHQENLELSLRIFIYIISCFLAYLTFQQFSYLTIFLKIFSIIFSTSLIIFCYRLIMGIPNPVNFNRNSASVALIAVLAERLKKNRNIAFVLLDNTASSNMGWRLFAEDKSLKDKTFIYIDCVAYGEKFVCAHNQNMNNEAKRLVSCLKNIDVINQEFPEEQLSGTNLSYFLQMLHLCTGAIEDHYFVVRNTRSKKDFKVDIPKLKILCTGLLNYFES
jgi:hypothetical protein